MKLRLTNQHPPDILRSAIEFADRVKQYENGGLDPQQTPDMLASILLVRESVDLVLTDPVATV